MQLEEARQRHRAQLDHVHGFVERRLLRGGGLGAKRGEVEVLTVDGAKFCLTINITYISYYVMHDLDAAFSALADPTRRAILARLAKGRPPSMNWQSRSR
jgi:hypothetical protein